MIYKVYYQESLDEIPRRENTKSLYVEAESEREVRKKIRESKMNINIEFITPLEGAILQYEKQSEYFKVLEI